jgi:hypothetical protein
MMVMMRMMLIVDLFCPPHFPSVILPISRETTKPVGSILTGQATPWLDPGGKHGIRPRPWLL